MPQNNKKIKELSALSFEEALAKLENVVRGMEDSGTTLDQMIARFEEGRILAEVCRKKLNTLKQKVELLAGEKAGTAEWSDVPQEEELTDAEDDFSLSSDSDSEDELKF